MKARRILSVVPAVLLALPGKAHATVGLGGSPESMREQHGVAVHGALAFVATADEVRRLIDAGALAEVVPNEDFALSGVSFPYAVPEVKLFIERLGNQYRSANDAKLIVTSLTRPSSMQPRNAHELSVHPAGIAVDFRVPQTAAARAWLENTLLQLERSGVLDVTRERNPPHYHVAVFPGPYGAYAAKLMAKEHAVEAPPVIEPPPAMGNEVAGAVSTPAPAPRMGGQAIALRAFALVALSAIVLLSVTPYGAGLRARARTPLRRSPLRRT